MVLKNFYTEDQRFEHSVSYFLVANFKMLDRTPLE